MPMHGWFVRAGLLGLVATLVNIIPGAAPAQAVSETEPVAVPRAVRWDPRAAGVVGESSAGIVYMREGEPTSPTLRGNGETYLRAADGTETPLDDQANRVYGDRLVGWSNATEVRSRVLPSGEPEVTYVPDGYSLITITGDGLLLGHGPYGDRSLALLPWSSETPVPIEGLPSGRNVDSIASPAVADADGAVVYTSWSSGQQSESVYVDTATRRAWPLGFTGRNWGLGEDTISWLTTGADGERLIGTMPRPTAGHADAAHRDSADAGDSRAGTSRATCRCSPSARTSWSGGAARSAGASTPPGSSLPWSPSRRTGQPPTWSAGATTYAPPRPRGRSSSSEERT